MSNKNSNNTDNTKEKHYLDRLFLPDRVILLVILFVDLADSRDKGLVMRSQNFLSEVFDLYPGYKEKLIQLDYLKKDEKEMPLKVSLTKKGNYFAKQLSYTSTDPRKLSNYDLLSQLSSFLSHIGEERAHCQEKAITIMTDITPMKVDNRKKWRQRKSQKV